MIVIKKIGAEGISRAVVETCFRLSCHSTFCVKVHVACFKGKAVAHMVAPFRFYPMDIPAADILIEPVIIPS